MISPELLRRYPFFAFLDETQLKAVAMLSEEVEAAPEAEVFVAEQPADALYLLVEGGVDLNYKVIDREDPRIAKEFFINELNPGDIFGLSALLEPFQYTMTAKVTSPSKMLCINAAGLRALSELDVKLQAGLMKAIAKATMERLQDTRVQLAAARA